MEPSNNGHIGDKHCVHCSEVVPSSEVEMYGQQAGGEQFVHCRAVIHSSECPLSEVPLYTFLDSLSMQPPFLPEIIPDMLVVSTHYCSLYCSQLQNLMQKLLHSCLPTMTQTNNTTTTVNNRVTTVNKQQRKKTNSLVQQQTKTRIFKNLRLPLRKTREWVQRSFPSQPREQ